MNTTATVQDIDLGMNDLMKRIRASADHVDIGIHADAGEDLVKIAAVHEYGATIKHPGGTSYGYRTQEDAKKHRITFLAGGAGYKVLGVTKPHVIVIPMRSYIRSTMDENQDTYSALATTLVKRIIAGEIDKHEALALMGQQIESDIKRKIVTMKSPPLKPATIARKGSSSLLQDHGTLKNSIRYVVLPKEGSGGEQVKEK